MCFWNTVFVMIAKDTNKDKKQRGYKVILIQVAAKLVSSLRILAPFPSNHKKWFSNPESDALTHVQGYVCTQGLKLKLISGNPQKESAFLG